MKEVERFNEAVAANKEMLEEIKAIGHDLNPIRNLNRLWCIQIL